MSFGEIRNFTFDSISIWDWYDGIVRATAVERRQHYLIILAAWDMTNSSKAYVLLELGRSLAARMKNLEAQSQDVATKQEAWDSFTLLFEQYLRGYTGTLCLTFDEPEIGREISSTTVEQKYAQKLKDYDFENTLTETACALWFGLGGDFGITTRARK